jgi:hypothetical protein
LVLLINVSTLSSTKLQIRAKQFLLRSEGARGRGREMTQTLYAHMNKRNKNFGDSKMATRGRKKKVCFLK